jgi:hypothetical protein
MSTECCPKRAGNVQKPLVNTVSNNDDADGIFVSINIYLCSIALFGRDKLEVYTKRSGGKEACTRTLKIAPYTPCGSSLR